MPFCPRCRCEYNIDVPDCIDCRVPLVLFRPSRRMALDLDFDDFLMPMGALLCFIAASGFVGLRYLADAGQIEQPLSTMIVAQPYVMTVFFAVAAVMSGIVFFISLLRLFFFRD